MPLVIERRPAAERGEPLQVGLEDVALEHEVHELALALDLHQARRLELLDVVREGRGADVVRFLQGRARAGRIGGADLLQDLEAARLGEGACDARELALGERGCLGGGHRGRSFTHAARPSATRDTCVAGAEIHSAFDLRRSAP